jgi:hypothetical protein
MDGIIYLLNQAGIALAQANAEISALREEGDRLKSLLAQTPQPDQPAE